MAWTVHTTICRRLACMGEHRGFIFGALYEDVPTLVTISAKQSHRPVRRPSPDGWKWSPGRRPSTTTKSVQADNNVTDGYHVSTAVHRNFMNTILARGEAREKY